MLYHFVRPLARITFKLLFRNVRFEGLDHIPKGVPVIFATNHPSAFLEPCLMACWLPKPLSFIVRGDLFKNKFTRSLLGSINLIPMFRVKDGGLNIVKNNFESIRYVVEYLNKNKWLMILAEGHITPVRRLGKMKKGTARLAFGALDLNPESELVILPVGADFSDQTKFGTDVHFKIGDPIRVRDYYADYLEHNNKGIMNLTKDLYNKLEEQLIQIPLAEDDELSEMALKFFQGQHPITSDKAYDLRNIEEKKLTKHISDMDLEQKKELKDSLQSYQVLLESKGLKNVLYKEGSKTKWSVFILHTLLAPFGLPNALFVYFTQFINNRISIVFEFITSVFFASVMVAGLIFYSLIIGFIATKSIVALSIVLVFACLGYLFARNRFAFSDELNKLRFKRLDASDREQVILNQELLSVQLLSSSVLK